MSTTANKSTTRKDKKSEGIHGRGKGRDESTRARS